MTPLRLIALCALAVLTALPAQAFDTRARAAWVYDLTTQTVLLEKDADIAVPPASMSKLMTLNMLFEAGSWNNGPVSKFAEGVTIENSVAASSGSRGMGVTATTRGIFPGRCT